MLGLVLLYFLGKAYYDLAEKFNKNRWLFAVLGVVSYYAGSIILGGIGIIVYELGFGGNIDEFDDLSLDLMTIPLGLLSCWLVYKLLERIWIKAPTNHINDVLDEGMID